MAKKVIIRTLLGFPLGVFIGYTVTILISIVGGDGAYWAVVPQLADQVGSVIGAVLLQYLLSGILGAACAGGSCVWEAPNWSLLKQTIVHYIIIAGSMFPIAWFAWWMPHTLMGALAYIGIFMAIYAVIFVVMFLVLRRKVKKMDNCLKEKQSAD